MTRAVDLSQLINNAKSTFYEFTDATDVAFTATPATSFSSSQNIVLPTSYIFSVREFVFQLVSGGALVQGKAGLSINGVFYQFNDTDGTASTVGSVNAGVTENYYAYGENHENLAISSNGQGCANGGTYAVVPQYYGSNSGTLKGTVLTTRMVIELIDLT